MTHLFRILLISGIVAIACSCATPSSPTGGPPDRQGPEIIRTEPETGTVNFEGRQIVFHFSEYVERSSFTDALTIEPQLGLTYELDWGRKSVAIEFEQELPDLTTLIVTLGTDFSDMNGNSIASPFKVAVSTGPEIDEGKLVGRLLDARTGEGEEGHRVLLYRTPVDLAQPANYIGETDTSGTVHFSYLRQGKYKAFWVDDRNRNKIWDPERERAQPFPEEFVTLQKSGEDTLGTLYIAGSDTSKPVLQGVGLFSSQRLRLRFSENITLTDSSRIRVQDSTGTGVGGVFPLYVSPEEPYVLFAHSSRALAPEQRYRLEALNIADPAGNVAALSAQTFTGSAQEDTTAQRIVGTSVGAGIFPGESIRIAYAAPITQAAVRDSLKVVAGDSLVQPWPHLQIERNRVRINPGGQWKEGQEYEFRPWNPATQSHRPITPTIWYETDLGALRVAFSDTTGAGHRPTRLLLKRSEAGELAADTVFTGQVTLEGLAPVDHQLILYQDLNGNGEWDAGTVAPFEAPEPYFIQNAVPIQGGFTADMEAGFED